MLALIDHLGEATPYDLKRAIEESVSHFWPVPHTTFYQEPTRLADAGYLSERQEQHGRRRKRYALTDAGREALRAWATRPAAAPPQYRDEALLKIFAGADPLPLLNQRHAWCLEQVAELERRLLDEKWRASELENVERTILAGLAYYHANIALVEAFMARVQAEG